MELNELLLDKNQEPQWRETARWIKFEEDVEEETERWGKPHVASLSFRSLLELRRTLAHGNVPCPTAPSVFTSGNTLYPSPFSEDQTANGPHVCLEQYSEQCHQSPEGTSCQDVSGLPCLGSPSGCPGVFAGRD